MANGPLSPVMLIAASGLMENQGLAVSGNLTIAINQYQALSVISNNASVIAAAVAAGNTVISPGTLTSLRSLGANTLPALTNAYPGNLSSDLANMTLDAASDNTTFVELIAARANTLMGDGDIGKMSQMYSMSRGYISIANQFVNSINNVGPAAATFIDMDAIITGGISLITSDPAAFGADLAKLGLAINLADLNNLGYPSALLRQILDVGGLLPSLRSALALSGVTVADISTASDSTVPLVGSLEKRIYSAFGSISGSNLTELLSLLGVTTPGLTTAADLLDPVKIFSISKSSLVFWNTQNIIPIYSTASTVNPALGTTLNSQPLYQVLSKIIPPDQALVNRALSWGLFQIKNVITLTLPELAAAALNVQTNFGLTDINNLDTPLPSSSANTVISILTPSTVVITATGANGTFTLYDFMGTAAGYPHTANLNSVVSEINGLVSLGDTAVLTNGANGSYPVMLATLAGAYGNVSTGPITGLPSPFNIGEPFADADTAFTDSLIPITNTLISTIAVNNPNSANVMNQDWTSMADQLLREDQNFTAAEISLSNLLANSKSDLMTLSTSLHEIGADITSNGPANFFNAVANTASQSGQAVVASLREGRNIQALEDSGIAVDTQLNAN